METQPLSSSLAPPPPGTRLGDFVLQAEIGRGGMGVVYRAWQESLQREVAVKLLRDSALTDPLLQARFRTEALAAAALQHPGIVRVHESGNVEGVCFYAMDYVEGRSLAELVRDGGPLEPRRAAVLAAEAAEALQHAHELGVVHRDVKPSNILVDTQGRARVLDFGLARREGSEALTLSGDVLGTPGYMSPEQAEGRKDAAAPATDIFGVGAVLYFMLTGRAPFTGDSASEVLRRAADGVVTPPRKLNVHTPRDLENVCLKCLRRTAGERYGTAAEVAADLRRFCSGESVLAQPVSIFRRSRDWLRRRPRMVALFIVAIAALGALGGWLRHQWLFVWEREEVCVWAVRTVRGPEPVRLLSADEWTQRQLSTRVVRRGTRGPVVRLESISGDGRTVPGGITAPFFEIASTLPRQRLPVRAEMEYDSSGRITEETMLDSAGGITGRTRWIYPKGADASMTTARVDYFDAVAAPLTGGTSTFSARVHTGDSGEWERVDFLDNAGQPSIADKGVYSRRMKRPGGSLTNITEFLDRDGTLMDNADGVARIVEAYSDGLKRKETRTFNRHGQPAIRYGYHLAVELNDAAGNVLERTHFKEDGVTLANSSRGSERGASRVTYSYAGKGRIALITASGFDPAISGYAVKRESRDWPDDGRVLYTSRTDFFDAAGKAVRYKAGYFIARSEDDYFRRPLRMAYEGYDPAVHGYWAEDIVNTWGEGRSQSRIQWSFRDAEGKPARSPKGYLHADEEYDTNGRLQKITRTGYDGSKGYVKRVDIRHYPDATTTKEDGRSLEYYDAAGQRVEVQE